VADEFVRTLGVGARLLVSDGGSDVFVLVLGL
jgi:hypothetical protein